MNAIHDDLDHPSPQEHTRVLGASSTKRGEQPKVASHGRDEPTNVVPSRKRKAESDGDGHVNKKPFILRPYPPSMYDRPSALKALHCIDRARLPLCYLDTTASESRIAQQRFFSSDTDLLKDEAQDRPQVLIARLELDKTLYAVERVEKGTYAVCRLAHWVKMKDLQGDAAGRLPGRVPLQRVSGNASKIGQEQTNKDKDVAEKTPKPQELSTDPAEIACSVDATMPKMPTWQADEHDLAALDELAAGPEYVPPVPTQRQSFEKLVCQYMETLYFSRTSLAFFTKGPLSRTRAAFTAAEGKMTVTELALFLRSLCIQSSAMDKKYREKLPEVLKEALNNTVSDDEALTRTPQKKKAPRRLHPTRGGMFPLEEDYVQRWWYADDANPARRRPGETVESLLRRRLNDVRLRETLLQIVITLETLALEASPDYKLPNEDEIIASVEETQETQGVETQSELKPKRPRKPQDLNSALDVLVDKLCIWQSVEEDGASSTTPKKDGNNLRTTATPARATNTDLLRDFFSEVILPFYLSRLPKQVSMLGKKLGGPNASPAKRPAVKPGAAIVRRPPKADDVRATQKPPRKSLHRIATDTAAGQKQARAPSLVRFSSDSAMLMNVKRERSMTPALSSIPSASPTSRTHSRRGSVADFNRLNKRQVDLTALSAATEAKQKKKAVIDEQVKNAISTLRKPNRGAAVKEMIDFSEKRRAVLVNATPKRVNKYAAITPRHVARTPAKAFDPIPSSGVVPATSSKPRQRDTPSSSVVKMRPQITETPRSGARLVSFRDVPIDGKPHEISTSVVGLAPAIFATPSKPRKYMVDDSPRPDAGIFATPLKGIRTLTTSSDGCTAAPAPSLVPAKPGSSIYDALGWDDEFDELA